MNNHPSGLHPRELLRQKFRLQYTTYGLWVTLESPSITEIAGRMGFDWVVIDAEHGHLDLSNVLEHVRVANLMGLVCFVRLQDIQQGLIKRALDIGADGILVPQVRTAEEVALAVRYARYPPDGVRGIGAERSTRWGMAFNDCTRNANREIFVIPLMETVDAGNNIEAMIDVPGVDAFYFGPADYSASAGFLGEWEGPGVAQRLLEIKEKIRARGLPCGIMSRSNEETLVRREQNFRMIGLGMDTGLLIRAARQAMEAAGVAPPPDAFHCSVNRL